MAMIREYWPDGQLKSAIDSSLLNWEHCRLLDEHLKKLFDDSRIPEALVEECRLKYDRMFRDEIERIEDSERITRKDLDIVVG